MCWACRAPAEDTKDTQSTDQQGVIEQLTTELRGAREALTLEQNRTANALVLLRRDAAVLFAKTLGRDWAQLDEQTRESMRELSGDLITALADRIGVAL